MSGAAVPLYSGVHHALRAAFGVPLGQYPQMIGWRTTRAYGALTAEERIAQDAMVCQALRAGLTGRSLALIELRYGARVRSATALKGLAVEMYQGTGYKINTEFIVRHVLPRWAGKRVEIGTLEEWAGRLDVSAKTLSRHRRDAVNLLHDWEAAANREVLAILEQRGWV